MLETSSSLRPLGASLPAVPLRGGRGVGTMPGDLGCAGGVWTGVPRHSQPPAHTLGGRRGPKDVSVPVTETRAGV